MSTFTPRCHATVCLFSARGSAAAISVTAVAGSRTLLWTIGMAVLHTAACLMLLRCPRAPVVPLGRRRPPVVGWLRGRPVPCVLAVPMVALIGVCGLHARAPSSGTGVSCAASALPPPVMLLLLVSCLLSWCLLRLHSCLLTPKRAASRFAALALLRHTSWLSECLEAQRVAGQWQGGLLIGPRAKAGQWWPL